MQVIDMVHAVDNDLLMAKEENFDMKPMKLKRY
jgi:hypothetical protein